MPTDSPANAPERAPYVPPALEPLGTWSTLTLQQSFPLDTPAYSDGTL